jgi:hypothetical protein
MNVVQTVFPNASPIVCRYHVSKNVLGKCKSLCKTRDGDEMSHSKLVQRVMDSFEAVLDSQTKECYVQSLVKLLLLVVGLYWFLSPIRILSNMDTIYM